MWWCRLPPLTIIKSNASATSLMSKKAAETPRQEPLLKPRDCCCGLTILALGLVLFVLIAANGTALLQACTSLGVNTTVPKLKSLVNFNTTPHSSRIQPKTRAKRYAYVLMAYDVPGAPIQHIWRALALVRSLQRLSDFPILLMSNTSHFPDGTRIRDAFGRLNCQVLPVHAVPCQGPLQSGSCQFGEWHFGSFKFGDWWNTTNSSGLTMMQL